MTQIWKKISFWNKVKAITATCGAGGEIAVILNDMPTVYHAVVISATIASVLITHLVFDKDNDGVVDLFEDSKPDEK